MAERATWTTQEFGTSHAGAVGVLLADGTVPGAVFFDAGSGAGGERVTEWSVYDGRDGYGPRAAALRAVCSCGWAGVKHPLAWEEIGEEELAIAGAGVADTCMQDWDTHAAEVDTSAVALPQSVTGLLDQLENEIEKLTKTSPLAAVRAARQLEVSAVQVGYWAARDARKEATPAQAAAALGLSEDAARNLLARFGRWSPYLH
ncbi:hypothetical protein NX794_20775 [Streptomyces sp. LP11]|uniref:Uncharacterized protein n=1 Tax=Streptomyces pyxinicus TaxID=2970331 RepID=A0ABT2B544_9ACTN|nr:hypothetical protein [Streptomyces sp. LP11]MCS0603629.1 hypothetical protein [Streptomyces sp. LP11]